jgi:hypothetical protein
MEDSIVSPTTNAFDYTKFASYLKKNKQNLQTTFADDPKYIKNLEDFNDVLKILSRKNTDPIISQEKNALNDLIRARVGMFTLEGRIFTSAQKIFNYRLMDRMNTIITDPKALEKLLSIRAVNISWQTDETNKENLGLIAQDVENVFPQVVDESKSFSETDDTEYLSVRYTELIPVLVKAIQELKAENNELREILNRNNII